ASMFRAYIACANLCSPTTARHVHVEVLCDTLQKQVCMEFMTQPTDYGIDCCLFNDKSAHTASSPPLPSHKSTGSHLSHNCLWKGCLLAFLTGEAIEGRVNFARAKQRLRVFTLAKEGTLVPSPCVGAARQYHREASTQTSEERGHNPNSRREK